MPFVKGQSGNPGGRPKKRTLESIVEKAMAEKNEYGQTYEYAIVIKVRDKATEGDLNAVKILWEYYYGKPAQQVDMTSNGQTITPTIIQFVDDSEDEQEVPTALEAKD
jgi:hypothetical protein